MRIIDREPERVATWMKTRGHFDYRPGSQCIGLEKDGVLVAGTMYDWFNGASVYIHTAIDEINREYLWFCFYYPFEQLGANVLIGLVGSKNLKAQRLDKHLGFQEFARIPGAHPDGELIIYTMEKRNCRWLHLKKPLKKAA